MKDEFVDFLEKHKGKRLFLTAAPGNSGDTLLQKGLLLHLQKHKHTLVSDPEIADIIVMHGGGSIDDVWGTGFAYLKQILAHHTDAVVVVAPSTIHFAQPQQFVDTVTKHTKPAYFFCRDKDTKTFLESLALPNRIHIKQANDTAFLLAGTDYLRAISETTAQTHTLAALRTDRESRITWFHLDRIPQTLVEQIRYRLIRWQLRRFMKTQDVDSKDIHLCDVSYLDYETFVSTIAAAKIIYTDRLHVAILGVLLKKEVHVYPTRYSKIQGVYEASLHLYPSVIPHFT